MTVLIKKQGRGTKTNCAIRKDDDFDHKFDSHYEYDHDDFDDNDRSPGSAKE